MVNNMDSPILRDVYTCTLTSDRDIRHVNVVASSFGQAAANCLRAILLWENKESYTLTKIQLSDSVFINLNNFIK